MIVSVNAMLCASRPRRFARSMVPWKVIRSILRPPNKGEFKAVATVANSYESNGACCYNIYIITIIILNAVLDGDAPILCALANRRIVASIVPALTVVAVAAHCHDVLTAPIGAVPVALLIAKI